MVKIVCLELRRHAPFTLLGTASGIGLLWLIVVTALPANIVSGLFWGLHPFHVLISAMVTTAVYRRYARANILKTIIIGYIGSVGIATISDCLIPYVGERLLNMPHHGWHVGFIEKWWLVNPMAFVGIAIAFWWSQTRFPHAAHVFLSTWASLMHMRMAQGNTVGFVEWLAIAVFLFLAVWVPCCTSDIVFPLLFSGAAPVPGDARAGQDVSG